jgi:hypothetical protein
LNKVKLWFHFILNFIEVNFYFIKHYKWREGAGRAEGKAATEGIEPRISGFHG